MAVFISVTTSAFQETFENAAQRPNPQNLDIRRPLRGIEIKEDTYSIIKVLDAQNNEVPFVDSSSTTVVDGIGRSKQYSNFVLTNVSEQRVEKQQIIETFGEDYIFFFGERPRMINVQGVLINTRDFNWKDEFWENYENILRGTRLLERSARMYLYFDSVVVEGYMLQAQTVTTAENPYHLPLQFQMFVTNYATLSSVGSVVLPSRHVDTRPDWTSTAVEGGSVGTDLMTAARLPAETGGSLNSFLADASAFHTSASFAIQSTLDNIKNVFFGRRLVSSSLGAQVYVPPLENQAETKAGPIGVPLHENWDEYVERKSPQPEFDEFEKARVRAELELRSPEALEAKARLQLAEMGVDVSVPSADALLLGRAAFVGLTVFGSFGLRQADGVLNVGAQLP